VPQVADWNVFDANCRLGRHLKLQEGGLYTAEHLLEEMDHYGVAEALVIDSLSRENHPSDGNERVLDSVSNHPRLHPAWSALPHGPPDEQPDSVTLVETLRKRRVGALFLYPEQYKFNLSDWCVDAFLEPLAAAAIPVFIDYNEVGRGGTGQDSTDWDAVVDLCRRWPNLPVIVSEFRIRRTNRLIYRALDACDNLHIELSAYWLHHGIEFITRSWGARRLVYGSNWPMRGPGATLATLTCSDISDDDKRLIAGDNLRRLVSWCQPKHPALVLPPPADRYVGFGRSGTRPDDMTFLDNHGHLGGQACHYHLPDCDLDSIVAEMDRLGVEKTCAFSFGVVFSDEKFGNDDVAEAVRCCPDRFVGFTGLNPHRGEQEMLTELERCRHMGLRGIKLIPHYQGYPEDGPLIDVACQWAHEHHQIILNHSWGSPEQMERLLQTYPDACFFTGHCTTAYADLMRQHDNLYVCSCPLMGPRSCEEVVTAIGADRLMFGSDLEDLPIAWGLGPILFARISEEEKRMIFGENLRKVLETYSLAET